MPQDIDREYLFAKISAQDVLITLMLSAVVQIAGDNDRKQMLTQLEAIRVAAKGLANKLVPPAGQIDPAMHAARVKDINDALAETFESVQRSIENIPQQRRH